MQVSTQVPAQNIDSSAEIDRIGVTTSVCSYPGPRTISAHASTPHLEEARLLARDAPLPLPLLLALLAESDTHESQSTTLAFADTLKDLDLSGW